MAAIERLKKRHPYNIELFDFHRHYMSLLKLAMKTMLIGPDVLSSTFFLSPHMKCIVATQLRVTIPNNPNHNNYNPKNHSYNS